MSNDKGGGLSLRRKKTTTTRPKISAPQQLQRAPASNDSRWDAQTTASSQTGVSISSREPRPSLAGVTGDKTSDIVKRRYSTRFTGAQDFGFAGQGNVPAVPSLPSQYARPRPSQDRSPGRNGRDHSREGTGKLKVDLRALNDSNLQAEKYVQGLLAEATTDDIMAYRSELQNVKSHASADLQHNVYQNRTQFIRIAKEADKLKSEMRTLRTLMGELTGALGHATSAGGAEIANGASLAERKRANRSSVANLEAMWSSHLQVLWKRVEGSQKYLPAIPGRHIILESSRWVELNAATWKPRRRVTLVLLNDHLLIASEKKKTAQEAANTTPKKDAYNAASQTTLVAERCWPLQEVSLADLASATTTPRSSMNPSRAGARENEIIKNAINVRAGSESFTYATSDTAEKLSFLVAFRKAQEDQRKRAAAEHGEREKAMDELAILTGRDPRALKRAAAAAAEEDGDLRSGLGRSNSLVIDVEGRQQSIRYVEAQIDGLDIDIALQRFEDAVERVEKLRTLGRGIKGNATAQEIILGKVNERATKLATAIARQLVQTSAGAGRTKDNVQYLVRLGFEEMARNRYLESRSESLRLRQRQLPFTGPLPPYLQALSFVTFNHMAHTFRAFSSSFPQSSGSAVVKWGREKMDDFCSIVSRQIEGVDRRDPLQSECQQAVLGEMAVLSEVGVDFGGLILQNLNWTQDAQVSSPQKSMTPAALSTRT